MSSETALDALRAALRQEILAELEAKVDGVTLSLLREEIAALRAEFALFRQSQNTNSYQLPPTQMFPWTKDTIIGPGTVPLFDPISTISSGTVTCEPLQIVRAVI